MLHILGVQKVTASLHGGSDHQLRELRAMAKRHGWRVVGEFVDHGISGATGRDQRPQFDAMLHAATRREFDGLLEIPFLLVGTLPTNDPWFGTHYPPNGWGCRCRVFAITKGELGEREPDRAPPIEWQTWTDPRTGQEIRHPKGVDPGWDYAPGASLADRAREVARRKLPRLDPDLRQEVEGGLPRGAQGRGSGKSLFR